MRGICKIEGLDLLRDGITDCNRKLSLAVTEGIIVQHRLEGYD